MSYYFEKENVEQYIKMAEGFDGRDLINYLKSYLKEGASVLELGMGPGTDLEILKETYDVTGSDYSKIFTQMYKQNNPTAKVLVLDARLMNIENHYDCIYSNKVLYHLSEVDFLNSINKQYDVLNTDGLLLHSLWLGQDSEESDGLIFTYYTMERLKEILPKEFEILEMAIYSEMETNDSVYFILKKL